MRFLQSAQHPVNPKNLFLVILFLFSGIYLKAQTNLDSLWTLWNDTTADSEDRLTSINKLIFQRYLFNDPDSAHILSVSMLELATATNSKVHIANGLGRIAASFYFKTEYDSALYYYEKAIPIHDELGEHQSVASIYGNMGNMYADQGNYPKAIDYYMGGLKANEKSGNQSGIASKMNNIGLLHRDLDDTAEAMKFFNESLAIFEELDNKTGQSDCLLNMAQTLIDKGDYEAALPYLDRCAEIHKTFVNNDGKAVLLCLYGLYYFQLEEYEQALTNYNQGLDLLLEMGNDQNSARALVQIGRAYMALGQPSLAIAQFEKAKKLGKDSGAISPYLNAANYLSKAYRERGDFAKSVDNYALFVELSDSTRNVENKMTLIRQQYAYSYEKQLFQDSIAKAKEALIVELAYQKELHKKDTMRNVALGSGLILFILAGGLYSRNRYIKKSRDIISRERDRSEGLLLNILPAEIAEELKEKGKADARDFELVSILFTDFIGFTEISSKMNAQELVSEINSCFESFDGIMIKYDIEKIKTIGDAYMAAGGLPAPSDKAVTNTVRAALEMQEFISRRKKKLDEKNLPAFQMRVGIHTGPVVAGIVGVKKFQYDLWGDTVNTASRMESNGELGKVNISHVTYKMIEDNPEFKFESRGKIFVKGKGDMEMWFVTSV